MNHPFRNDLSRAALLALALGAACMLPPVTETTSDVRVLHSDRVLGHAVTVPDRAGVGEIDDLLIDTASGTVVAATVRGGAGTPGTGLVELAALKRGPEGTALEVQNADDQLLRMPKYEDLFEGKTPVPLEGEIRSIERVGGGCSEVRLVDAQNLFHRVTIEAASLVMRRAPRLAVGQRVRFQAIETRDERGKLWIASQLDQDSGPLVLRDAEGRLQWRNLGCIGSRQLVGSVVHTADDREGRIVDWSLDWGAAVLTGVLVELDGMRYELTWTDLVRADDGTWRTPLLSGELRPIDPEAEPAHTTAS